jgi:hypothetical protein
MQISAQAMDQNTDGSNDGAIPEEKSKEELTQELHSKPIQLVAGMAISLLG